MRVILGVCVLGIVCGGLPGWAEARQAPPRARPVAPVAAAAPVAATAPAPAVSPESSGAPASENRCGCDESDQKKDRTQPRLEFSFGSGQKFFDQSVYEPGGFVSTRTLPVTTLVVLGEWLAHPRVAAMVLFDLPLEPRTRLAEGELSREYVAPSLSGGARASIFALPVLDQTVLEWQFAFLMGSTLADIGRETVFPTLGWRLHLSNPEGLTLYAGATFEFLLNRAALVYGVGQRF